MSLELRDKMKSYDDVVSAKCLQISIFLIHIAIRFVRFESPFH